MKQLCVLGVVDNERGQAIKKEMLAWLDPLYDVNLVIHDGSHFEYPALQYAQALSIEEDKPVLYLHTKGAFNRAELSEEVREMWKHEFGGRRDIYFGLVNRPFAVVACPFTGSDKTTWYNGFVANAKAWSEIPPIGSPSNRMKAERLFIGQKPQVIGVVRNDMHRNESDIDRKARNAWIQFKNE